MEEKWKSLKGIVECGTYYEVSNFGRVRSIDRNIIDKNGKERKIKGRIMKQNKKENGYMQINLKEYGRSKYYSVHRLVAMAFIPNIKELPCVNHKDENKENNNYLNLEWCDMMYNNHYGNHIERCAKGKSKRVKAYKHETNEFIGEFESVKKTAEFLGLNSKSVSAVCRGDRTKHKGYYFKYVSK